MYYMTGHDASVCIYHLLYKTHQCFYNLTPHEIQFYNVCNERATARHNKEIGGWEETNDFNESSRKPWQQIKQNK